MSSKSDLVVLGDHAVAGGDTAPVRELVEAALGALRVESRWSSTP